MKITVIGSGYVGLVTGSCLATMGNVVTCFDIDEGKVNRLINSQIDIYEPGLNELVQKNYSEGRLIFTSSVQKALDGPEVVFICVGTPSNSDGSADLSSVLEASRIIGQYLESDYCVIATKSTVPVGATEKVREKIREQIQDRNICLEFDVVNNPEFLKEGSAISDFMSPDRVLIGSDCERASQLMRALYLPFCRNSDRIMTMGIRDSELTKYAANSMLATKISFINEISNLCERLGVDVENVRLGMGSDRRIGYDFIYPGSGYGGSCLPKDVKALAHLSESYGVTPLLLSAVHERNLKQKRHIFEQMLERFDGLLNGTKIGFWGLSFKPDTNDMRNAPSITLINELISAGAYVSAYDPMVTERDLDYIGVDWIESELFTLATEQYQAVKNVEALVLMTEWKEFRSPDFDLMKLMMAKPVIFDGRNQYSPSVLKSRGFEYHGIGRGDSV